MNSWGVGWPRSSRSAPALTEYSFLGLPGVLSDDGTKQHAPFEHVRRLQQLERICLLTVLNASFYHSAWIGSIQVESLSLPRSALANGKLTAVFTRLFAKHLRGSAV